MDQNFHEAIGKASPHCLAELLPPMAKFLPKHHRIRVQLSTEFLPGLTVTAHVSLFSTKLDFWDSGTGPVHYPPILGVPIC